DDQLRAVRRPARNRVLGGHDRVIATVRIDRRDSRQGNLPVLARQGGVGGCRDRQKNDENYQRRRASHPLALPHRELHKLPLDSASTLETTALYPLEQPGRLRARLGAL